jgi:tetratricopeptide (TPR) repeat protein
VLATERAPHEICYRDPSALGADLAGMADVEALIAVARDAETGGALDEAVAAWRKAMVAAPERIEPVRELARLLRTQEKWNDLLGILKKEAERGDVSIDERYALWVEMARVSFDKLDREFTGLPAAKRALEIKHDGIEALDLLIGVHESKKAWAEVLALLERRLAASSADYDKVVFGMRILEIASEKVEAPKRAVTACERILEVDPTHAEARRRLPQLYAATGNWDALVDLERKRLAADDVGDAREQALALAKFAEGAVKRSDIKKRLWEEVRALDPGDRDALRALEQLYTAERAWKEVAGVIMARTAASLDPKEKAADLQKLSLLYEKQLAGEDGAAERAVEIWHEILLLDPDHRRARAALTEHHIARGDVDALDVLFSDRGPAAYAKELAQILKRSELPHRVAILRRAAGLCRDELDDPKQAIAHLEAILAIAPSDAEAIDSLAALSEAVHDDARLARVLPKKLELASDPAQQFSILLQLASLHEESLKQPAVALEHYLRAYVIEPQAGVMEKARELAAATKGWRALVQAHRAVAERASGAEKIAALEAAAELQEAQLKDTAAAARTYDAILRIDPLHEGACTKLGEILLAQGRLDEVLAMHTRRLDAMRGDGDDAGDHERRLRVYHHVAGLLEQRLGQPAAAFDMLARAVKAIPSDAATLDWIERLASSGGELAKQLVELYRGVLKQPLPVAAQLDLRARLGRAYEGVGDESKALAAYRRILDLDSKNARALEGVARLIG